MQPEQIEHINIVNWLNYQYPEFSDDFHHFANERQCSIQQGRLLKRMGVKKGVSDFFLALPLNGYAGMWLELKVGKGRLSPSQVKFLKHKSDRGYFSIAVWGYEAAVDAIKTYIGDIDTK